MLHLATPGTESRRGLSVQSAKVRSSIGVSLSETRPILSRSIVEEVSGVMRGVLTLAGNVAGRLRQRFAEHLAGAEHVRAFLEDGGDDGQALDGLGAQRFHVAQAVDHGFDGERDEQFDLLGRQAGALGLDGDLRLDEIGEDVELGVGGDVEAVAEHDAGQRDDYAAELQREMDEGLEHG